jgi:hypothetical protein
MQLYVICRYCNNKIYINNNARVRSELPYHFFLHCTQPACPSGCQNQVFTSREVHAEQGVAGLVGGALVLGALGGLVAGPAGAILGGILGGAVGSTSDQSENDAVWRFNNS